MPYDETGRWYDEEVSPEALAMQQAQQTAAQQTLDWYKGQGLQAFNLTPGALPQNLMGPDYTFYNAGNGIGAYVNPLDPRFIAQPKNTGLGWESALGHPSNLREMHGGLAVMFGGPLIGAAGTALAGGALAGGAAEGGAAAGAGAEGAGAAEGGAALAGGGEVGSGYAASAPGWGAGEGTIAGGAGSESLVGGAGSDTAGGGAMGEDLFYDPSYYDAGNTSYFETGGADPYGTGVDMYGNPTGEYSPSTFQGDGVNTGYGEGGGNGGQYTLEDLYKMGQKGYGYAQQAKSIYDKYKGLFGAGAGALAGALGTPKQAGVTTTTEDLPDWLKGPAQLGVTGLANAYNANPTGQTPLLAGGSKYLTDVINGQYLNNNPYLDAMYDKAAAKVSAGVNALFSKGGRYGSGAHQGVLGEQLGNLATDIYGGNYARERANQQQVGMQAPTLSGSILSSGFVPAQNLLTGIGAVRSRNISTPYFDSKLGNVISGALGGKSLFA